MAWVLTIAILFVLCRLTRNKSATVPDVCPDCCLCDCAEKGCGYLRYGLKPGRDLLLMGGDPIGGDIVGSRYHDNMVGLQPGEIAAVLTPGESWWECPGCGTWGPTDEPLNHLPGCSVHRS